MPNQNLKKAKNAKQDEFYTQLGDIEAELCHYKKHFEGKRVLCNCDDPRVSNFLRYFVMSFNVLKLKSVTATCYKNNNPDLFSQNDAEKAIKLEYFGGDYHGEQDFAKIPFSTLKGNGDFRSSEVVEILKRSDIVVTNPPFSLFREYVNQLIEYDKKFIIIGNKNAITYKEIFKLIKENKIWIGVTPMSQDLFFQLPKDTEEAVVKTKKQGSGYRIINDKIYGRSPSIWFTNLDIEKRHEPLETGIRFRDLPFQKYDNYDAIEVSRTCDIPMDYSGVMGVPITFLDKYCPEQFEIVALGNSRENFTPSKDYVNPKKIMKDGKIVDGGAINCVLALENDEKPIGQVYYTSDNSKYLIAPYARILIRKRQLKPEA